MEKERRKMRTIDELKMLLDDVFKTRKVTSKLIEDIKKTDFDRYLKKLCDLVLISPTFTETLLMEVIERLEELNKKSRIYIFSTPESHSERDKSIAKGLSIPPDNPPIEAYEDLPLNQPLNQYEGLPLNIPSSIPYFNYDEESNTYTVYVPERCNVVLKTIKHSTISVGDQNGATNE